VFDAAFSPNGNLLVTSSSDGTAQLWSVPGGEQMAQPLDLHRTIQRVAFAPDGRSLITQDFELIRRWTLPQDPVPMRGIPLEEFGSFAALSPDGALVTPSGTSFASNRDLRATQVFCLATGEPAGPKLRPGGGIVAAAFAPDGQTVATLDAREKPALEGQELRLWDWASGTQRWHVALPSEPRSLCFRPDGQRLAVLCAGGEVILFNPGDGDAVRSWQAHEPERADHWINNGLVRYSPDGGVLLIWGMGKDAAGWDGETGERFYPPLRFRDKCHDLQFAPDGKSMALASYDGSVRVHEVATGRVMAELPAQPDMVYSASFSPDGRLLVTTCRDRAVRVWDWRAGKLVCPQFEHTKDATAAVFTPDGRWVLSVSNDGIARAWDWQTGKPVTPPLVLRGNPTSIVVTADGKHAVVGGMRTELAVLDLAELSRLDIDVDSLCLAAELAASQRHHEGGGTVNLSAVEWLERWRTWRGHGPRREE
jgi:WD40 repeat protein